ncbi:MFS transporter [Bacillus cereus]|nr:MFS transporter [Bacillus cereus]
MKNLYSNKDFMILWSGQSVSKLGNRFFNLAIMWYVAQQTGSSLALGLTIICFTLPTVIIGPLAGVWADKYDKNFFLVWVDILNGILMIVVAWLMTKQLLTIHLLYFLLILSSSFTAIFNPFITSTVPLIVCERFLSKANSLTQFSTQLSNVIGPALAGILIASTDNLGILILINGITFILSGISVLFIHIPKVISDSSTTVFLHNLKQGFECVIQNKQLLYLLLIGGVIINFFLAPLSVFFTIICNEILNTGAVGLGMINSSMAIGAIFGTILVLFNLFQNKFKMVILGLLFEGIALFLMGIYMQYYMTLIAVWILGLGLSLSGVGISTLYQSMVPKEKMGRVLSIVSTFCSLSVPLGTLFGSIITNYIPLPTVLWSFGIVIGLSGLSFVAIFYNKDKNISMEQKASNTSI